MGETRSAPGVPTAYAPRLVGRDRESHRLAEMLVAVERSTGAAIMVLGDAGIGKTALLADLARRRGGVQLLRVAGADARTEPAFSGLQRLLGPVLSDLDALPAARAEALHNAFGLTAGALADRFAVSLAVLELFSEVAARDGLLCLVDDVQWLDRPSLDVLLFVARRLEAEPIAMVFAARDDADRTFASAGLPALALEGLDDDAALELVAEHAAGAPAPSVRRRVLTLAEGNPLALIELPAAMTDDELAGRRALPEPLALGRRLEAAFLSRIGSLGPDALQVLLIAAADATGRLDTLERTAPLVGARIDALEAAEAVGIVTVDAGTVTFTHSLARWAVYHAADPGERRRVHLALAEVLDTPREADRHAWHLAAAATGPSEPVAAALERSAQAARVRGGAAAAVAALERSAELSEAPGERSRRLVAAAQASWQGGRPELVEPLLARAAPLTGDVAVQATAALAHGAVLLGRGQADDAFDVLMRGAEQAAGHELALELVTRAAEIAWWTGRASWAHDVARLAARAVGSGADGSAFIHAALTAGDHLLSGRIPEAGEVLRHALVIAEGFTGPRRLILAGEVAELLGDDAAALRHYTSAIGALRAGGAVSELPFALWLLASVNAWRGRVAAAAANADEGLRLARAAGEERSGTFQIAMLAHIAALQGREEACRAHADEALASLAGQTQASPPATVRWALGRLELGLGRPAAALEHLLPIGEPGSGVEHAVVALYAAPDAVEAAVQAGRREIAEAGLARFERWSDAGSPWARAVVPRLRGCLAEGDEATAHFEAALTADALGERPFEDARARLLYGAHLRRVRRRIDAREQLRVALGTFETLGLEPWAERTRAELRASGEAVAPSQPSAVDKLSPQELQVARFVSRGASNREVAEKLFLSPRTIEYHLSKIYAKLGISSRAALPQVLGASADKD